MSPKGKRVFQGFQRPNYTMVPDELFDDLLPDLTGAELKVLLYIVRRTFGFKKDSDNISLSQMMHGIKTRDGRVLDRGVGLTKKTVLGALRSLEESNIILTHRRQSEERGNEPTEYRLNVIGTSGNAHTSLGGINPPPLGEKVRQGVRGESPPSPSGRNYAPQETETQETERHISNSSIADSADKNAADKTTSRITLQRKEPSQPASREREVLTAYMKSIALELHDQAPLRSTVTRLLRIYERSEMESIEAFIDLLYQARAIAREHTGSVRSGQPGARQIIPYFIAIVEDLAGLKNGDR